MFTFLSPAPHVRNSGNVNAFCNFGGGFPQKTAKGPLGTKRKWTPACRCVTGPE